MCCVSPLNKDRVFILIENLLAFCKMENVSMCAFVFYLRYSIVVEKRASRLLNIVYRLLFFSSDSRLKLMKLKNVMRWKRKFARRLWHIN